MGSTSNPLKYTESLPTRSYGSLSVVCSQEDLLYVNLHSVRVKEAKQRFESQKTCLCSLGNAIMDSDIEFGFSWNRF